MQRGEAIDKFCSLLDSMEALFFEVVDELELLRDSNKKSPRSTTSEGERGEPELR
jgi:hypothetical protein